MTATAPHTSTGTASAPQARLPAAGTVAEVARRRFSCRTYRPEPLAGPERAQLSALVASVRRGPFSAALRFRLIAATEDDVQALRGLGTYGFLSGTRAFLVGAVSEAERSLEDYGYGLEELVLGATAMGLGTCWLGGTFRRSRFAEALELQPSESLPAVVAVGHPAPGAEQGLVRRLAGGAGRKPWAELFFDRDFGTPLSREAAGPWSSPLETLRLGPSASNRQPWRVVRQGERFHLFLRRTPGYRDGLFSRLLHVADLQRVDLGIAMCHFELQARDAGLEGGWVREPPALALPPETTYVTTWRAA